MTVIVAIASMAALFTVAPSVYASSSLLTESFTGSSTVSGEWTYGGNSVCLTAGDGSTPSGSVPACDALNPLDTAGNGVLRLTQNATNSTGFVLLNTPLNSEQGFSVSFDMYQYGTQARHADGIGLILIDGSYSPSTVGGFGGSLGYGMNVYRENTGLYTISGIQGGYLGVGFDVFGNFPITSCPNAGNGSICDGYMPNSIGVRGAYSANYDLVTAKTASGTLGAITDNRDEARRTVTVTVSPSQRMSVTVDYHDGNGPVGELSDIDVTSVGGAGVYPATFKLGFSGSTGGYTDYHELRNLSIQTLDPDLSVLLTPRQPVTHPGSQLIFDAVVENDSTAAPTIDDITTSFTFPDEIIPKSASGAGWNCTIAGQIVTCSRSGSGANALQPNAATPPIAIVTSIANTASVGDYTIPAVVTTAADSNASNDTNVANISIQLGSSNPDTPKEDRPNNDGLADTGADAVELISLAVIFAIGGVTLLASRR